MLKNTAGVEPAPRQTTSATGLEYMNSSESLSARLKALPDKVSSFASTSWPSRPGGELGGPCPPLRGERRYLSKNILNKFYEVVEDDLVLCRRQHRASNEPICTTFFLHDLSLWQNLHCCIIPSEKLDLHYSEANSICICLIFKIWSLIWLYKGLV